MNPLRIRFVTWNMGDNKKTPSEWENELSKMWALTGCDTYPFASNNCFDILAVTVQEDYNGQKYGKFSDMVGKVLNANGNWQIYKSIVAGPPDVFSKPFSVKLYVYINPTLTQQVVVKTASSCHQKQLIFCSKGTAGISLYFPETHGQIILMGSHFPVKPKQLDMGYKQREKAIYESLVDVFNPLKNQASTKTIAIWGGDMNFRRNTPVTDDMSATPVDDQLDHYLATNKSFRLQEAMQKDFQPTCRFNEHLDCKYNESTQTFSESCQLHKCADQSCACNRSNPSATCYDTKRTPSYCDRILFHVDATTEAGANLIPIAYKSWAAPGTSVESSDHNLVWADFVLQW